MKADPVRMIASNARPVDPTPSRLCIPEWQQFPPEKRQELTQILAGMLIRQVQEAQGRHERPS